MVLASGRPSSFLLMPLGPLWTPRSDCEGAAPPSLGRVSAYLVRVRVRVRTVTLTLALALSLGQVYAYHARATRRGKRKKVTAPSHTSMVLGEG